ncbi:XdhC family protein [Neptunicella sp. SCSIO 80796]|uniref:XdhC family protein n=1 Tax=Neptunicella plasticusilytica TaxID=3117012 RepID=UPI003A4D52A6
MNQFLKLLEQWLPQKDQLDWVLATIVSTDGSTYRKPGAMMMINSLGQYFGLLSGGCLEADIMRQARQCWDTHKNRLIEYDMREEDDLAWQLGLGCGGMVRILLQPILASQNYLQLQQVYQHLSRDMACGYRQNLDESTPDNQLLELEQLSLLTESGQPCRLSQLGDTAVLTHYLTPPVHLAVFGGGVDARPVVNLAATLGWQVTVCDPRIANGRAAYFKSATRVIHDSIVQQNNADWFKSINAALVMTHSVDLDAQALALVQQSPAQYLGILGPVHRTDKVLERAQLSRQQFNVPLANPVGLRLGGDLPESIALAMIAEIHSFLYRADGQSISKVLTGWGS